MAKSQLEIVLVDESDGSAPAPTPTTEAVQSSSAGVPARQPAGSTAVATPEKPTATSTAREAREPSSSERRPERRDTTAVDVAGRVAEMTVRAFGLGNLVGEIQRWQQILRDVGGLFKSSAVARIETEVPRSRAATQVEQATERQQSPPSSESQQPARRQQQPEEQQAEHPAFASVKHFMRVTAPKAFGDFTAGAVDAIRTFFGGPDSDDQPTPTAAPSRPAATAARDDRQQPPIKVQINQPATSSPLGAKVLPPPLPSWTPPPRPAAPSGIPLPTVTAPTASPPAAPPMVPAAYVPKPPIQSAVAPTAVPATPAASPAGLPASMPVAASTVPATAATSALSTTASVASSAAIAAPSAAAGVGGIAAALGPVGIAAVAVSAGLAALAIGAQKLTGVLSEAVAGIAGYSADVSSATAESEIRQERAMVDRGARIGPEMAQFERSRGKMEERFTSMGTDILGLLAQLWNAAEPFMSGVLSVGEAGVAGLMAVEKQMEIAYDFATGNAIEAAKDMKDAAKANEKFAKEIKEIFEGEKEEDPLNDQFNEAFFGLGAGMASKLGGPVAPRRRARGGGP